MPYDPRLVSEGGNRGVGELFTHAAPKGKFRVIGVDTFDGGDWVQGDFPTKAKAMKEANEHGGQMTLMHVFDDKGIQVGRAGTF